MPLFSAVIPQGKQCIKQIIIKRLLNQEPFYYTIFLSNTTIRKLIPAL